MISGAGGIPFQWSLFVDDGGLHPPIRRRLFRAMDVADKLISLLLKWAEHRQVARSTYFEKWVEPTYASAKTVSDDLLNILDQLEQGVVGQKPLREIVQVVEQKRQRYVTLRDALRSYLATSRRERWLGEFDDGIALLLNGVLGSSDEKSVQLPNARRASVAAGFDPLPILLSGHPLLDVLYRVAHHSELFSSDDTATAVRQQRHAIREATSMMTRGYLQLKLRAYPDR